MNPVTTAEEEFQASCLITAELTKSIVNQDDDVSLLNNMAVQNAKNSFRKSKEEKLKRNFENICKLLPEDQIKYLESATEKGASSWLAVLPLKNLGYSLNKQEFQDAVRFRYGWTIPDIFVLRRIILILNMLNLWSHYISSRQNSKYQCQLL